MKSIYQPKAGILWDHWLYLDKKGEYHLYYLYAPAEQGNKLWHIAHAVSRDLETFEEKGIVLSAHSDYWIDKRLATGSVIEVEDRYVMIFTAHSTKYGEVPALAWSDDLYHWKFDDHGPLVRPEDCDDRCEGAESWGVPDADCCGWADPYVFRIDGDENYYFLLNGRIKEGEPQGRGRALLFSSPDLYQWKFEGPLDTPHMFKRMETQQIVKRNNRWYLIFSSWAHLIADQKKEEFKGKDNAAAFVLTADNLMGPYEFKGDFRLFPDSGCYICKIITDPNGEDRVITIVKKADELSNAISCAYKVTYPEEGGIRVEDE